MLNLRRIPLPPGYVRDSNNPGLIKLSGSKAAQENQYIREIRRLDNQVQDLKKEVKELKELILTKLNKNVVEKENV